MVVSGSIDELPTHIVLEILTSGRLSAMDLVYVELSSSLFGGCQGLYPMKFRSLVDLAAAQLCDSDAVFESMGEIAKKDLFDRCGGNWKRVLRFLQSVGQASCMVETSIGNLKVILWCGEKKIKILKCVNTPMENHCEDEG